MQQRVGVIGYGVTGKSVAAHLARLGKTPVVVDTRPVPVEFAEPGEHFFSAQSWPDHTLTEAVLSPGLAMDEPLLRSAREQGVTLCSDIDLFFAAVEQPVLGVTGTNGKSTVVTLAGHLLVSAGYRVGVGGNLGPAALDLLLEEYDIFVLELSSFQLERSQLQPYAAAVILNISEDHADQHGGMVAYVQAKQRVYERAAVQVINLDDAQAAPQYAGAEQTFFCGSAPAAGAWGLRHDGSRTWLMQGTTQVLDTAELQISGAHNHLNAAAACALVSRWLNHAQLRTGLVTYRGLEHRFEHVAEIGGVQFINDSKATNVGATLAALDGFDAPGSVILIAGGDAKGADLAPLSPALQAVVGGVVALGRDAPALQAVCADAGVDCHMTSSLKHAVAQAAALAQPGQCVLLSPACASLDMFRNYAERGQQFCAAVQALAAEREVH